VRFPAKSACIFLRFPLTGRGGREWTGGAVDDLPVGTGGVGICACGIGVLDQYVLFGTELRIGR
jgi:hypothetical protein